MKTLDLPTAAAPQHSSKKQSKRRSSVLFFVLEWFWGAGLLESFLDRFGHLSDLGSSLSAAILTISTCQVLSGLDPQIDQYSAEDLAVPWSKGWRGDGFVWFKGKIRWGVVLVWVFPDSSEGFDGISTLGYFRF